LSFDTLGFERVASLRVWMWGAWMRKRTTNH
jgi:hypothetical protein